MTDIEQCRDCWYWRSLSGSSGRGAMRCCHYALDFKRSRIVDGDVCISKKTGPGRPSVRTSVDESTGKSTYCGYKTGRRKRAGEG